MAPKQGPELGGLLLRAQQHPCVQGGAQAQLLPAEEEEAPQGQGLEAREVEDPLAPSLGKAAREGLPVLLLLVQDYGLLAQPQILAPGRPPGQDHPSAEAGHQLAQEVLLAAPMGGDQVRKNDRQTVWLASP